MDDELAPRFASAALLTIDVQRDFLSGQPHGVAGTSEALPAIRRVVAAFRAVGRPIVHVVRLYRPDGLDADLPRRALLRSGVSLVRPGTAGSQLADGLAPPGAPPLDPDTLLAGELQQLGPGEYVMYKPRWGAFYRTPLHERLRAWQVSTIVVVGCNLPNCPRATLVEASERDYRTVVVGDAVSRADDRGLAELAGLGARVLRADEVVAGLGG